MASLPVDPTPSALAAYVHSELRAAAGGGGSAASGEDDDDGSDGDGDGDGERRVTSSRRHRGSRRTRRPRHRRSPGGPETPGKNSGGGGGGGGGGGSGGGGGGGVDATVATQEKVMGIISTLVGRDVESDEPLMDSGLDSLSGAELKSQMEAGAYTRPLFS